MAKYNLRWTDDELTMMAKCVADGCTLKETLERFEGTKRTKGAISSKRRQLIKAGVSDSMWEYTKPNLEDLDKEAVVEYLNTVPEDAPAKKQGLGIKGFLILAVATASALWLLTEGNYIDWS